MSDPIKAPINYAITAGGQFVKGGSVIFGVQNIRPDADNPATLKPIYLDSALSNQAENPQGLSSDAVFDQADNGVLFGADGDIYSIIILDANDVELSYIPSYHLSDAAAAASAQTSAAEAQAAASQAVTAQGLAEASAVAANLSYEEFVNRYLGSYASDPATDPAGNPPIEGSLYWNTSGTARFKVFTGGTWEYPVDMGFGTMAYIDAQTSPTDATAGRGLLTDALGDNGGPIFTEANLNPNVFGGVTNRMALSNGGATNATQVIFSPRVFAKTGTVVTGILLGTGTYSLYLDTGVLIRSGIPASDIVLSSSTGGQQARIVIVNNAGLITTDRYELRSESGNSTIEAVYV